MSYEKMSKDSCLATLNKYDTQNTRVPYSQYFRQMGLIPVIMGGAEAVYSYLRAELGGEIEFRESDQQVLLDGVIETGYYYDEGHLWKRMK